MRQDKQDLTEIETLLNSVRKKAKLTQQDLLQQIDFIEESLRQENLEQTIHLLKEKKPLKHSVSAQNNYYMYLSKVKKSAQKVQPEIKGDQELLDWNLNKKLIVSHWESQEKHHLTRALAKESQDKELCLFIAKQNLFKDILSEAQQDKYEQMLFWLTQNNQSKEFIFRIQKQQFLQLLLKNQPFVKFSREHFAPYYLQHPQQIKQLMTSSLFGNKVLESQYRTLFEKKETLIKEFKGIFAKFFNPLIQFNPLHESTGPSRLELLLEQGLGIFQPFYSQEGPVNDPLKNPFHSIAICPVSKDPVRYDKMMLTKCGHLLSKQALTKMGQTRTRSVFRCPLCNTEQRFKHCRPVFF